MESTDDIPRQIGMLSDARAHASRFLHRTPLWRSQRLSTLAGAEIYLKLEPFQKTGSFKVRGMIHKLQRIVDERRATGVVTFSAGNAAQGLAYAARCLGLRAMVVMTPGASPGKIAATRGYGATVVMASPDQQLEACALDLAAREQLYFVHPCDDVELMTGHASLGLELIEDLPEVSAVVTAIGGGGMAGGLSLVRRTLCRQFRLIGVEPQNAPHMHQSLLEGRPVTYLGSSIAEGLCPPALGKQCFQIARDHLERVVLVAEEEIRDAMNTLLSSVKIVAEPSGATALAGVLSGRIPFARNEQVAVIVSGGNIDLDRLKSLL